MDGWVISCGLQTMSFVVIRINNSWKKWGFFSRSKFYIQTLIGKKKIFPSCFQIYWFKDDLVHAMWTIAITLHLSFFHPSIVIILHHRIQSLCSIYVNWYQTLQELCFSDLLSKFIIFFLIRQENTATIGSYCFWLAEILNYETRSPNDL